MTDYYFVVITGLSGAGKTLALRCFEDMGYFCVDNLPAVLIPKFNELCRHSQVKKVAIVIDIRGGEFFNQLFSSLKTLQNKEISYEILFLEASDEALIRRYSETRRKHPLAPKGRILNGIKKERRKLREIKEASHKIINTTHLTPRQLKEEINASFITRKEGKLLDINVVSFGYKYGLPLDADLLFDVRFLPNPYYVQELQGYTGADEKVRNYVMKWPETGEFMQKLFSMLDFLIPHYINEGKAHLTIAIGCTGGKHRSIVLANELYAFLKKKKDYSVRVYHRDQQH